MGFSPSTPLTQELLTDTIIGNMERLNNELKTLAIAEISHFFPSHPEQALRESIRIKQENNGNLDYNLLLTSVINKHPKFNLDEKRYFQPRGNVALSQAKDQVQASLYLARLDSITSELNGSGGDHQAKKARTDPPQAIPRKIASRDPLLPPRGPSLR